MNIRRGLLLASGLALFALGIASCDLFSSSEGKTSDTLADKVRISLRASGDYVDSSGRTVLPSTNPDISGYELFGAAAGKAQGSLGSWKSLSDATVTLETGTYDFTLLAKNSEDTAFLSGSLDGLVLSGTAQSLSFTLTPLSSGTGNVSIVVSWPTSVSVASAIPVFNGSAASALTQTADGATSTTSVTYTASVETGSYVFVLKLMDDSDNLLASVPELVRVYPNMASQKTIALSEDNFNSAPEAPSSFIATTSTSARAIKLSWSFGSGQVNTATSYQLRRKATGEASYAALATIDSGATLSYTDGDASLVGGASYDYELIATNSFGTATATASGSLPYTVNFDSQGGTSVSSLYVAPGDSLGGLPTNPSLENFTFSGWYTATGGGGTQLTASVNITADITVYAWWRALITFDANGGSGTSYAQTVTVGAATGLSPIGYTCAGFPFLGWSTSSGATSATYSDGANYTATGNVTLYAVWSSTWTTPSYADLKNEGFIDLVDVGTDGTTMTYNVKTTEYPTAKTTYLSPYRIAQYETVYSLWYTVYAWATSSDRGTSNYTFGRSGRQGNAGTDGAAPTIAGRLLPVTQVTWRECAIWCNALTEWYNAQNGTSLACVYCVDSDYLTPIRSSTTSTTASETPGGQDNPYINEAAKGFRLPTELQWQYAASLESDGVTVQSYNQASGDTSAAYNSSTVLQDYAWYDTNVNFTQTVGKKLPNGLGLYDMSGNVWEWCSDWYSKAWSSSYCPYSGVTDYASTTYNASAIWRNSRGGAVGYGDMYLQVGFRMGYQIFATNNLHGLRISQAR